jgi:hypothetical protein
VVKEFTLERYKQYLDVIKSKYEKIITFREYFENKSEKYFCIIRHDVDRKAGNALKMAEIEKEKGIKASYYFRIKSSSFKPDIINKIAEMGHEIGYHYENLSDTNGNYQDAYNDFKIQLERFKENTEIKTISMHGRPFRKFDNRDLWKSVEGQKILKENGIYGEIYLDIDYSDILYISDTGRNWHSDSSNVRDKVASKIKMDFETDDELMNYLKDAPHNKMVFQIHPERWSDTYFEYKINLIKDSIINKIKAILN